MGDFLGGAASTMFDVYAGLYTGGLSEIWQGNSESADAQANIASARQRQAEFERQQAMKLSAPTTNELLAMTRANEQYQMSLGQQEMQLQRQAAILAQSDPAVATGFQGMQDIMAGKSSPFADTVQKQIEISRQQTQNRLLAAQGSGAQTSSSGMQANALFGQQAAMAQMQANQNAFNMYGSMTAAGMNAGAMAQNQVGAAFGMSEGLNKQAFDMSNALQGRQVNAALGSGVSQYQGSQYVGDLLSGQNRAAMGGMIFNGVGTAIGAMMGGPGGAAAGNQATKGASQGGVASNGFEFTSSTPVTDRGVYGGNGYMYG